MTSQVAPSVVLGQNLGGLYNFFSPSKYLSHFEDFHFSF